MIKRVSKFRDERRGNVDSGRDILEPVRRAAERRLSAAAPTRPIAAIVFAHAADTVLPAVAAPPMFFSIAAKYVAESTLLGDHVRERLLRDAHFGGEPLVNRQPADCELVQIKGVCLALGLNLVDHRAHLFDGCSGDRCRVGSQRQVARQVLAGLDSGGDGRR